jgi:hypothetical protein
MKAFSVFLLLNLFTSASLAEVKQCVMWIPSPKGLGQRISALKCDKDQNAINSGDFVTYFIGKLDKPANFDLTGETFTILGRRAMNTYYNCQDEAGRPCGPNDFEHFWCIPKKQTCSERIDISDFGSGLSKEPGKTKMKINRDDKAIAFDCDHPPTNERADSNMRGFSRQLCGRPSGNGSSLQKQAPGSNKGSGNISQ